MHLLTDSTSKADGVGSERWQEGGTQVGATPTPEAVALSTGLSYSENRLRRTHVIQGNGGMIAPRPGNRVGRDESRRETDAGVSEQRSHMPL